MLDTIKTLLKEVDDFTPKSKKELEEFRLRYLGKKGKISAFFDAFKDVPAENKKEFGQAINALKQNTQKKVNLFKSSFKANFTSLTIKNFLPLNLQYFLNKFISLIFNFLL